MSAYLYYFLPWNLCRLCLLLPSLNLTLSAGDTITDLGCGPLTFASALWIANPSLREIPLEINCIDRSSQALEAGKKFFTALCESTGSKNSWKINSVKEDIDLRKTGKKRKQAVLVCAVNLFNEIYENIPHSSAEGLRRMAASAAKMMQNEAKAGGSILTVEPGVPQSGRFISFLREAFLELNHLPASPCTHGLACPAVQPGKKRWCHFAFDAGDSPKELHRLSAAAKLPKQRLVFSYLLTKEISTVQKPETLFQIRVISDAFSLPNSRFGRYGCSAQGLVLLAGTKSQTDKIPSGSLITHAINANGQRDQKSGALIIDYQKQEEL